MITPLTSMQIPWKMAQARRSLMAPFVAASETFQTYCNVWATVYGANK